MAGGGRLGGGWGILNDKLLYYYNSTIKFSTHRCKITRVEAKVLHLIFLRGNFFDPAGAILGINIVMRIKDITEGLLTTLAAKTAPADINVAKTATSLAKTVAPTVIKYDKFQASGLNFVLMPTKIVYNNQAINAVAPVVNYEGRAMVIVRVNGNPMVFYCSSGGNPKAGVTPGKWYPVFGIGPDGWINKGTSEGIAKYYGVPALRSICQQLDAKIGDIRANLTDITRYGSAKADAIAVINQGRNPAAYSDGHEAFKANAMAQLKPFL